MSYCCYYSFLIKDYSCSELCHVVWPKEGYRVAYAFQGVKDIKGCVWKEGGARFKRLTALNVVGKRAELSMCKCPSRTIGELLLNGYCNKVSNEDLERIAAVGKEPEWIGYVISRGQQGEEEYFDSMHSLFLFNYQHNPNI